LRLPGAAVLPHHCSWQADTGPRRYAFYGPATSNRSDGEHAESCIGPRRYQLTETVPPVHRTLVTSVNLLLLPLPSVSFPPPSPRLHPSVPLSHTHTPRLVPNPSGAIKAGQTTKARRPQTPLFRGRVGSCPPARGGAGGPGRCGAPGAAAGAFPLPAPQRHSAFSEQLPRVIYVASQEGLPGFLFHL